VVPGISSLDTIFAEVGYDPANGLLVYEADGLVRDQVPILTNLALLLLQPGAFGSNLAHLNSWRPDLAPLRDYICQFHAPDHECACVWSLRKIWRCKLRDLDSLPAEALGNSSLFIPPAGSSLSKTKI
jgi:hypothetical protein